MAGFFFFNGIKKMPNTLKIKSIDNDDITFSLGKDKNGNKVLKMKTVDGSFSIQTNGNLPYTHSIRTLDKSNIKDVIECSRCFPENNIAAFNYHIYYVQINFIEPIEIKGKKYTELFFQSKYPEIKILLLGFYWGNYTINLIEKTRLNDSQK